MSEGKQHLLLEKLRLFYNEPKNCEVLLDALQQQARYPSLRTVDWLITNYARKHAVTYEHEGRSVNLCLAYKDQLRAYSKRQFDPFNRRKRIVFPIIDTRTAFKAPVPTVVAGEGGSNGKVEIKIVYPKEAMQHNYPAGATVHKLITTVCQLNFFKFAMTTGVLRYARENKEKIERDMLANMNSKPSSSDGEAEGEERSVRTSGKKRSRSKERAPENTERKGSSSKHAVVHVNRLVTKKKVSFTMTFN